MASLPPDRADRGNVPFHDKNVYILGAGFSADAGIPLVDGFLQAAREYHRNPAVTMTPELRRHYDELFRFRDEIRQARDAVDLPLENIEALFSLVETGVAVGKRPRSVMDSIKHVIADTIERRHRPARKMRIGLDLVAFPKLTDLLRQPGLSQQGNVTYFDFDEYTFAVAVMSGLFDSPGSNNSFITLNYDLVLETALEKLGCVPDYCSDRLGWNGGRPTGSAAIKVLKLHGSINWADLHGEHPSVYARYSDTGVAHPPIIVPPTWNKGNFHPMMADVWAAAHDELKSATRICIVGYSMPTADAHFKYFIGSALAENPGLYAAAIVEFGRDAPAVKRYAQFFKPLVEYRKLGILGHWESPLEGRISLGLLGFLEGSQFKGIGRGAAVKSVTLL